MFIAGKCGAVKNATMASHPSLSDARFTVKCNNNWIYGKRQRGVLYTLLALFIHLPARGRDAPVRVSSIHRSLHIRRKGPKFGNLESGAGDINWCPG